MTAPLEYFDLLLLLMEVERVGASASFALPGPSSGLSYYNYWTDYKFSVLILNSANAAVRNSFSMYCGIS